MLDTSVTIEAPYFLSFLPTSLCKWSVRIPDAPGRAPRLNSPKALPTISGIKVLAGATGGRQTCARPFDAGTNLLLIFSSTSGVSGARLTTRNLCRAFLVRPC
jgi:hypothetical protein